MNDEMASSVNRWMISRPFNPAVRVGMSALRRRSTVDVPCFQENVPVQITCSNLLYRNREVGVLSV